MNVTEFTKDLKKAYAENLDAVVLYGSAADGEFHSGRSDINTIIVLKNIAPVEIARSNKTLKKWVKNGNPLPIFFTKEIIDGAADVFPIEFSDITARNKVLYGNDVFAGIKIDGRNLRHQCEHELRSKILAFRQRMALLSDRPKELIELMLESSSSFFAIFSGVLRLSGVEPAPSKKEIVEQLTKLVDTDITIMLEIIDVREKNRIWRKEEAMEKIEQCLTSIEAVIRYVDKL
ncbi:MAG: hypothetical protein COV46_02215 [Deltaproteobacteria bacterium CG11_big_fil_rev_8_21_14_0_20_49_13]|nr:MAG: hypothetical protein COV46_02215 [Deltaproteobacteria bacterium CG11_big_fil_rev_8_21_14_0_20_49_13]